VFGGGLGRFRLHLGAVEAMEAIALDHGGFDAVAIENVLKGALDGGGARPGGPRDGDDWMLLGHWISPVLSLFSRASDLADTPA